MTKGLRDALVAEGHEVEIVSFPFKFTPESYIENLCAYYEEQDFSNFNGFHIDMVVALQFPAYYVKHEHKIIWLMHQHRAVYELFDEKNPSSEIKWLQKSITTRDTAELSKVDTLFSMSKNVSDRLFKYNGIKSTPIYHPPFNSHKFYCEKPYNYIFYPSRLESLKRQDLLIKAMRLVKTPLKAIIAGEGGQGEKYNRLIKKYNLKDKVRLIGKISEEEKYVLYAHSLGVFFGPFDEDYGYISLEAMLSSKPVITCTDSGGPLEFVENDKNGFIVAPLPELIAEKLDWLWIKRNDAIDMGRVSLEMYQKKEISWENVVKKLLSSMEKGRQNK